jgi:hypothetical protein
VAYDLDEATVRRLTAGALARHADLTGRFVGLAIGTADPLAGVARTVERQVFEAAFGNDAATMVAEYGPYEQQSLFFLVIDRGTGVPAGAGRVIDGGGKTLDEAPRYIGLEPSAIAAAHDLHDGRIWDFATLAVLPEYRGRSGVAVSTMLYRTFLNAGRRAEVRHIVCMLDHRAHRNMMLLGAPLVPLAGSDPFEYLGSPSTRALYVPFADLGPSIGRQGSQLRRPGGTFTGEIRAGGLRRLMTRGVAARVSTRVASGRGLDEHIDLPGLERRRGGRRGAGLDRRRGLERRHTNAGYPGGVDRRRASAAGVDDRRRASAPGADDRQRASAAPPGGSERRRAAAAMPAGGVDRRRLSGQAESRRAPGTDRRGAAERTGRRRRFGRG